MITPRLQKVKKSCQPKEGFLKELYVEALSTEGIVCGGVLKRSRLKELYVETLSTAGIYVEALVIETF